MKKIFYFMFLFFFVSFSQETRKELTSYESLYLKLESELSNGFCEKGLETINSILEKDGKFTEKSVLYFANISECLGDKKSAIEALKNYVEFTGSFDTRRQLALKQARYGNFKESINNFKILVEKESQNPNNFLDLAEVLFKTKEEGLAVKTLLSGIEHHPENHYIYKKLAEFYYLLNRQKEAFQLYNKLLKKDKCNLLYLSKIIEYNFEKRIYKDVLEVSSQIVNCNPEIEEQLNEIRCLSYYYLNNNNKADFFLEKSLKNSSPSFNILHIKSVKLIKENNFGDALNLVKKIELLESNQIEENSINLSRFFIYYKQNNKTLLEEAIKDIDFKNRETSNIILSDKSIQESNLVIAFNSSTGEIITKMILSNNDYFKLKKDYNIDFGF